MTSDQRPAQYSRVIFLPARGGQASAECGDSPVSQSPLVTTSPLLQQSHLLASSVQRRPGAAGASSSRTTVGTREHSFSL